MNKMIYKPLQLPKHKCTSIEEIHKYLDKILEHVENDLKEQKQQGNNELFFNNYNDFCHYLGIMTILNNQIKKNQLKELSYFIDFKQIQHPEKGNIIAFIIQGLKQEYYTQKGFKQKQFIVPNKYKNSQGVYKIYDENLIYIGSSNNLYKRYRAHREYLKNNPITYQILHKNEEIPNDNFAQQYNLLHPPISFFELIEPVDGTVEELREREKYYIQNYSGEKILVNKNFNMLNKKPIHHPIHHIEKNIATLIIDFSLDDWEEITSLLQQHNCNIRVNKQTLAYKNHSQLYDDLINTVNNVKDE